jgi:superfamily I DNA/RNA helicase
VPVKSKNQELLTHGTKVARERGQFDEQFERYVLRENLLEWGATQYMLDEIRAGRWTSWIENCSEFRSAVNRFGFAAAMCREDAKTESGSQAGVRIGTVHSAKGMEADNVLILTTSSSPVAKSAALDQRGADEESRVAYVGVTRARERLFICTEKAKHRMPIPMEGDSQ